MAQVRIAEIFLSGSYMYSCEGKGDYDKRVSAFLDANIKVLPWREEMMNEEGNIPLLESSHMICSDTTLLTLLHNKVDFSVQSSQWVEL